MGNRLEKQIREYLLGQLTDEEAIEVIETRLMTDDDFAAELAIVEHDLIEEYLDDELTQKERKCFDEHFLIPQERQETLRLVNGLGERAAEVTSTQSAADESSDLNFSSLFRWLRFAAVVLVLGGTMIAVWRFTIYESDAEKGITQMRKAYEGQRLFESRITVLPDYAPQVVTRGEGARITDPAARDRAERYLLDAAVEAKDARAHHVLAVLNFAERKTDRALDELKLALDAAPRDARILSDAGAIYLELGRRAAADNDATKKYQFLDESLEKLDLAISIDPSMTEPRFNRALCLMALSIPERAREAWQEYLKIDSTTKWADEARRKLEDLDKQQTKEVSGADLESQFIAAANAGDEIAAGALISGNRELIRDKYLPQRLAAAYVRLPHTRRDELLRALRYAGEIESKTTGDTFAKTIARFYSDLDPKKLEQLSRAHAEIRTGYTECLEKRYGDALPTFRSASATFKAAGDEWNAALANYFVGYTLTNTERSEESLAIFTSLQEYAGQRGYLWLDTSVSHWLGNVNQKLKRHTNAQLNYAHALKIARKIGDSYATQRNLAELARLSAFVGQKREALTYLSQMADELERQNNSPRQKYRNYAIAGEMLSRLRLLRVAKELSFASMKLADDLQEDSWISDSSTNTSSIMSELGELERSGELIEHARLSTNKIADTDTRRKLLARAAVASGELASRRGDFDRAVAAYREAADLYNVTETPFYPEDTHRGLLTSLSASGRSGEVESQIASTIQMVESYRSRINDGEERRNYFSLRSNIYEAACDFEAGRGNNELAYNYAESGRARDLFDSLRDNSTDVNGSLDLAEIRSALPASVQLVQYAVLPKRMLIWVVTREKFVQRSVDVDSRDLEQEVSEFVAAIQERSDRSISGRSGSLYEKLIAPVRSELDPSKELAIIPHGVVAAVPFVAISSADGRALIRDFSITYSPSASVYLRASQNAAEKGNSSGETFLGIGNPAFDRVAYEQMSDLPSAPREVNDSASGYKSKQILIGRQATTKAFLAAHTAADVVHFAGHYVVTPDDAMSSFMLFADTGNGPEDSRLTNRELANERPLRTKLIVLAACQTGIGAGHGGEGMAGLASTFLSAKVPLVVASGWSVDSAATTQLMSRFHELRSRQNVSTVQALRIAQTEMLGDGSGHFASPFFWAGFAVYGGHAEY